MEKKKILYISQEITPYLPETEMSEISGIYHREFRKKGEKFVRLCHVTAALTRDATNCMKLSGSPE